MTTTEDNPKAPDSDSLATDLLVGCKAIADELGQPERRVFYLLEKKLLDADKMGRTWITTRSRLRRQFQGGEAA